MITGGPDANHYGARLKGRGLGGFVAAEKLVWPTARHPEAAHCLERKPSRGKVALPLLLGPPVSGRRIDGALRAAYDVEMGDGLPHLDAGHLVAIVETSGDFVGVAGLDGRTWFVNQGGRKLVGLGAEEDLSPLRIADYHSPEAGRRVLTEMIPQVLERGVVTFENTIRHRDGRDIPVSQMLMAHRDAKGNPECFSTVARDISDQKEVEERLRASEERFRLLIDDLQLGVVMLDRDSRVVLHNPRALDLLGLTMDQLLQNAPIDPGWKMVREDGSAFPYSDLPGILALRTGKPVRNMILGVSRQTKEDQIVSRQAKEDRIWLIANADPQLARDGSTERVVVTLGDISERKQHQESLLQSQRLEAMGRLAGGVAHDFNNLLTVVMGFVEGVASMLPEASHERADLEIALHASQRCAALTEQLLAFARHRPAVTRVLDLNATMQQLERLLRRLIGEQIQLRMCPAVDLWAAKVDPGQIEQVVMNLVINARDAMADGGVLTLETGNVVLDDAYASLHASVTPGEYVTLAVSDTGGGIRPEDQVHIFEPFFTTKGLAQGTGLGLATVHGIIAQHGGHIELSSEVGRGTTFKVYLPRAVAEAREEARFRRPTLESGTETLMLVEDEQIVRAYTLRVLERAGYRVLCAADPLTAIEMARAHQGALSLLVTDVIMPNMNGVQLAAMLRARRTDLKVLFVSGYSGNEIANLGVIDGDVEFLPKPFTADALLRKVREVLDGPYPGLG